jgi:hypothetical protein
MSDYKTFLTKLHQNLNTLREREAKYGGNAPLELLNQIEDHQIAISWTEQAISSDLGEAEWREKLHPLLVAIDSHAIQVPDLGPFIPRPPFMAEDLPPDFVPRPDELQPLLAQLLDERRKGPVALTTALRGAGGYGKTTLAKAVCHNEGIKQTFLDGILWVTLGEQADVVAGLAKLYAALTGQRPNFVDGEDAASSLAQAWGGRHCLLVVDDVWRSQHLRPFLRGGSHCARLITTRNSDTLPAGTRSINVDAMQQSEAVSLLGAGLQEEANDLSPLRELATRLGEWPLLLKLANGALRHRVTEGGQSLAEALSYVNRALDKRGLTAFDAREAGERTRLWLAPWA